MTVRAFHPADVFGVTKRAISKPEIKRACTVGRGLTRV